MSMPNKLKYIELFSGIGAFTQAVKDMEKLDFECVFASDIDKKCSEVFLENYGMNSLCDITEVIATDIPEHNFCFFSPPCQAFSKSGFQKGFEDTRGTLIHDVFRILEVHHPKYILMENVRNLVSHDNYNTISVINRKLKELGYRIPKEPIILSPHQFGVPQTRDRAFLPGIYDPENVDKPIKLEFDNLKKKSDCSIDDIIESSYNNCDELKITDYQERVLNAWNEFYNFLDIKIIGFPIWSDYFYKKTYDETMPDWKIDFIKKNQLLYRRNKSNIDNWLKKYNKLKDFKPTHKKFEWQASDKISSIWDGVIQFRPSGVRVKAPDTFPALVAIVQIPIIGKFKRKLSVKECIKLQSFSDDFIPHKDDFNAYKQLGNSINVIVLKSILTKLLEYKD